MRLEALNHAMQGFPCVPWSLETVVTVGLPVCLSPTDREPPEKCQVWCPSVSESPTWGFRVERAQ